MSGARHDVGFEDPILNSINFQINEDFNLDDYNGMDNMTYDLKVLGKEEAKEFVEDNKIDEDKIMSLVKFKLSIGAINSSYPFFVEIEYQSVFYWDKDSGLDEEDFLKINAPAILYSYCRPLISNISNLSKYPSLNIPFYNFTNN